LKWSTAVLAAVLVLLLAGLLLVLLFRNDPLGPIPGQRLNGLEVVELINDWSFTEEYPLLYIETRPADPYSTTITFFSHQDDLYVVCVYADESRWGQYLLDTPGVRLKIAESVYPGQAFRIEDPIRIDELIDSYQGKYPGLLDSRTREEVQNFWYFRIDSAGKAD
jgi:hypothetical protein